jgi:hypothetical protein
MGSNVLIKTVEGAEDSWCPAGVCSLVGVHGRMASRPNYFSRVTGGCVSSGGVGVWRVTAVTSQSGGERAVARCHGRGCHATFYR